MIKLLVTILCVISISNLDLSAANITHYPKFEASKCAWSKWKCKIGQGNSFFQKCILFRDKNCSSGGVSYSRQQFNFLDQRNKGISCFDPFSPVLIRCLAKPKYIMFTSYKPQWCPWQSWQPWSFVCIDAVLKQQSWLKDALKKYKNTKDASLWLRLRSRSCRCPNGRHGSQCSGIGHQAAFTPLASDLSVNGKLTVPTSRQSAWCPWSAWSGECGCSSSSSKTGGVRRTRTCRLGTSTAGECPGSASETRSCRCDEEPPSASPKWLENFFAKKFFAIALILLGLLLVVCCVFQTNKRRLRHLQSQSEHVQQQQQQRELLPTAPPQPATVSAPAAAASSNPLNAPPPSYEEAMKLVT